MHTSNLTSTLTSTMSEEKRMIEKWGFIGPSRFLCSILLGMFLTATGLAGTTGKISGKIRDAASREALTGATVTLVGTRMGGAADLDGDYFIINVPPGKYSARVSMVGYASQTTVDILVHVDRTTTLNFDIRQSAINVQEVQVTAERPMIQKDLTASISSLSARELELSPQLNMQDIIKQQRGVLLGYANKGKEGFFFTNTPSDALHIRGGRENETVFTLNGMVINDPMWGGSELIQTSSGNFVGEFNTLAGTFNAEYGNAMSGIINVVSQDGSSERYAGKLSLYTDRFGIDKYDNKTKQGDFAVSGPVPASGGRLTFALSGERRLSDGYIYGKRYPHWTDSRGKDVDTLTGLPNGSAEKLSMDRLDYLNGAGTLTWHPLDMIKMSAFYAYTTLKRDNYNHYFKYYREGSPYHRSDEHFFSLTLTHALNASTYYDVSVARQSRKRFLGVYDSWEDYARTPEEYDPSGSFFVIGENWQWHNEGAHTTSVRGSVVSQVDKSNLVKIGAAYRALNVSFESKNPNETGSYYMHYAHRPKEFAAFIQDKLEFSEIGLILNFGLRYDNWYTNAPYWTDLVRLHDMKTAKASSKGKVSPRLGVSYPISDIAAFHFAYGHFYQMPGYYLLYQGQRYLAPGDKNWEKYPDFRGRLYQPFTEDNAFVLGNANMRPEKSVAYEAGVQIKLAEDVSVDVTTYYREMTDLIGERFIPEANSGNGMKVADNYDYGNAKGIELTFNKRFSNYFSVRANYTFSKAQVTSSTPWAQLQITNPTYRTFTAAWDRPHTLNFDLYVGLPGSWDISLSGNFQSGMPYTIRTEPNTERAPFISTVDTRVSKTFEVFGLKPVLYVNVLNLLDRRNTYGVYPSSGQPDLPLGIPRTPHNLDVYDLPNNYGPGRQIYVGAQVVL
jgi:outer membrane receptor for ferrienterochelin and colicin